MYKYSVEITSSIFSSYSKEILIYGHYTLFLLGRNEDCAIMRS